VSKKIWIGIVLVLLIIIVGGSYAYFYLGASADVMFTSNRNLVCKSKLVENKALFPSKDTDRLYLGTKSLRLNSGETADPDGIYLRSGNRIYFTDGMKYSSAPEVSVGIKSIKVGSTFYRAKESIYTDISNIKLKKSQYLMAYGEYLYVIDLNTYNQVEPGFLYQLNGTTRLCGSKYSYEIDTARQGYYILSESSSEVVYSIKLSPVDSGTGKELPKMSNGQYDVAGMGQNITVIDKSTPSLPKDVIGEMVVLSGSEYIHMTTAKNSFDVIGAGVIQVQFDYPLQDGSGKIIHSEIINMSVGKG